MDVVSQAVRAQASDVHLDPEADAVRIRFRVDGLLHEEQRLPRALFGRLLSRIKILSDLDITEHRLPQDGRIRMEVDGHPVDLRVAILPVMRGEKVVLRVLDARHQLAGLSTLRLSAENAARIHRALDRPGGLMLAVGPTGSGKTTTLYAVLQQVASETVNTVTIEDPVEYEIAGLSQVAVNVATGLTFATGLRAILRQDPDVVMVGEIRDEETAEIATRAALTGHFVLSTLHTLGALETVDRLKEMGVPPYLLAAALRLVVSQRLVRRVCSVCAESVALSAVEQAWAERVYTAEVASAGRLGDNIAWPFPSHEPVRTAFGRGCAACRGLGLKGRLALHEVVYWDEALRTAVVAGEPEAALRQRAREAGSTSLAYDGLCKVALGETTVAEVMRAVGGVVP
jgi:type IV pilus assembly protein PilB